MKKEEIKEVGNTEPKNAPAMQKEYLQQRTNRCSDLIDNPKISRPQTPHA